MPLITKEQHKKALDKIKSLQASVDELNEKLEIAKGLKMSSRSLADRSKEVKVRLPLTLHAMVNERCDHLMFFNVTEYIRYCIRMELGFTHEHRDNT